jgi:hypothetical protein
VLDKCANHVCSNQFRYLHQGKLFEVEVQYSGRVPANGPREPANGTAQIERWWLCDQCMRLITLRFDRRYGLVMRHSLIGSDEVVTTKFPESSHDIFGRISRISIRSVDLDLRVRRNFVGGLRVQTREAA